MLFPFGGAALAPIIRPGGFLYGVGTGQTEPTSTYDFLRGVASGFASPESRTNR